MCGFTVNATINVLDLRVKELPQGFEPVEQMPNVYVQWEGPQDGVIAVSKDLIEKTPDLMDRLPWEFEELGDDTLRGEVYYRRVK